MKQVKLNKITVRSLSEIFQSLDIKFAYVNKKMEQVTVPAKCRDFLGDCIYSKKKKTSVSIYGFSYNYKDKPFDDCRLSLTFPDSNSYDNFINNINYLHEREKQAGVKLTEIFTTDDKSTLVIEGSNYWVSAVWKVSLYTFYLKLISYKSIDLAKSPEDKYIKKLTPQIESAMLTKVKTRKAEWYDQNTSTSNIHNNYGFYSMITSGKEYNPVNTKFVLGDI